MARTPRSRAITWDLIWRLMVANGLAALLVSPYIELSEPARGGFSIAERLAGSLLGTTAALLALSTFGLWHFRRRFLPLWAWVDEARPPTAAERAGVLSQPWTLTRLLFGYWLVAACGIGAVFLFGFREPHTAAAAVSASLLGGLTASAASFLLVERRLRPLVAEVLAGQPASEGQAANVHRRILVSWALGSGLPLFGVAMTPVLRSPRSDVPLAAMVTFLGVVGVVAGLLTMRAAARSIAEPLGQVRRGLRRIREGNLDVAVPVDDSGELGLLQAGFNDMVAAVRERVELQDLFGRHVGEAVARRALAEGVRLGGEVREASVLFVDLIGSTAWAATMPPEETVNVLNTFFHAVVTVAERHGGWVNKFEGDAALCVFGVPAADEHHAANALRAARELVGCIDVDAGIGVSTGRVLAGNVGAERRYEYTVIGDPVNEAARLTEEAKRHPERVLASEPAVTAAADAAGPWRHVATLGLRGRPQPTAAYAPDGQVGRL